MAIEGSLKTSGTFESQVAAKLRDRGLVDTLVAASWGTPRNDRPPKVRCQGVGTVVSSVVSFLQHKGPGGP